MDEEQVYEVESGVPIMGRHGNAKYPFAEMNPGDSFLVTDTKNTWSARQAAHEHARRCGMKFATRRVEGGLRVWRIA